ncbi:MAG: bifunctional 4-hydroxy-2-oxoglutarate aldolase/2-dehydro-3-deoxy-phosphogluconate aldolase [Deltaproteobacteria bacterium]|nr:bifunctional 4-hydroxy-2-oxoglutarate aldolase/2-dehydro-3-deoxy-phosphogluconate aldolase [Deltaproteobacteria bacterium]
MARHRRLQTLTLMKEIGIVPIFYQADVEVARQLVAACADGGARVVEFTNRGDHAIEVYQQLDAWCAGHRPDVVLGAGSVLDAPTAALYLAAGASFVVAPQIDDDTARLCNSRKIPYLPGCGTVTEIHRAHTLGVEICKLFPAGEIGGPAFIKNVRGPCPWADLMPTGGVAPTRENLGAWFGAGAVCVGMGSNLFPADLVGKRDFAAIGARVREVVALIREIRGAPA